MTYSDIISLMDDIGLPYAYDHFAEGHAADPPFAVVLMPSSDNYIADNKVFALVEELNIEVYSDKKDPALEKRVQAVLDDHEIVWEKSEVWIESERLYEVLYSTKIFYYEEV